MDRVMHLLHPPIAPWVTRTPAGCEVALFVRGEVPTHAFARMLADNEEELLPLQRAEDCAGWQCWRTLLPWDRSQAVTRYCFKLLVAEGQRWLGADGEHARVPSEQAHFRVNREQQPPAWVRDQVFYQVFPDRFARGSDGPVRLPPDVPGTAHNEARAWGEPVPMERPTTVFYGGDLPGLEQRLGHLQELGATAIYLNPIFRSRSNHKYDTEDYAEVDPGFGGNSALQSLRAATRERGIKLVLDAVVNHTGAQHPWFQAGAPERRRYALDAAGRPHGWKGYDSLPVLDYSLPEVKQAMFEAPDSVMRRWLQPPWSIDGWRLDAVHMLGEGLGAANNAQMLREMRRAVKAQDAGAYLVGEHFYEATSWLQGDQEDGAMNYYGFAHPLRAWLAGLDIGYQPIRLSTPDFAAWLREAIAAIPYDNQLAQLNLLDSHDTQRFLTLVGGDVQAMQLAVTLLMSFPGVPCVYYGDEIGLEGAMDPDCRRCFDWDRSRWNGKLFAHYRAAIARRQARPELRSGAFVELHARGEAYAFARFDDQAATVVAVNRGSAPVEIELPLQRLPNGVALPRRLPIPARGSTVWTS
jgi:alpha-glucosidase